MTIIRVPTWRDSITVNGNVYRASNGCFIPLNDADAAEMVKQGGILDGGPGGVPEWIASGTSSLGLVKPDGGTMNLYAAWDDLRFPAGAIDPAGAASAMTIETDPAKMIGTLIASGSKDTDCAGVAQMPHSWIAGSAVYPHIHWLKSTGSSSAVSWCFYYRILGFPGTVAGAWSNAQTMTIAAGDQTVTNNMILSSAPAIDMTGHKESSCILWRIERLGSSDADNNDCYLIEVDFHYQTSGLGTLSEIPT